MAEALKLKSEELQGGGGGREPERVRQSPAWLQRLGEYPRRFRQFLHEVRVEMRLVTWPTMTDVQSTTLVVIITVFFFGFFLFAVDLGVSKLIEKVLKAFSR
jgi:preprotein translocase subunit SecE